MYAYYNNCSVSCKINKKLHFEYTTLYILQYYLIDNTIILNIIYLHSLKFIEY